MFLWQSSSLIMLHFCCIDKVKCINCEWTANCERTVKQLLVLETAGHLFQEWEFLFSSFLQKQHTEKVCSNWGGNINIILSVIISGGFAQQLQVYFGCINWKKPIDTPRGFSFSTTHKSQLYEMYCTSLKWQPVLLKQWNVCLPTHSNGHCSSLSHCWPHRPLILWEFPSSNVN